MTKYEILSVLIACVAAITSLVVWIGHRRLAKEANELQRATSELAKKQLEILLREEKGKNTTRLTLDLVREQHSSFRFFIKNIGEKPAMDVELELLLDEKTRSPIVESEYKQKFPAKRIDPGSGVSLIAALTLSSPSAYNAILRWSNPDGSRAEEATYVAL